MRIKNIQFKVSAGKKVLCNLCKESVFGEDGYIKISYGGKGIWVNKSDTIICWKCFVSFLANMKESRKNRKKRFIELLKKQMLRKLKNIK